MSDRDLIARLATALRVQLDGVDLYSELLAEADARALMAEAQPQPAEPTDEYERGTVISWLLEQAIQAADDNFPEAADRLTLAAQLLGGSSPAPEPVSVAERMPTQELNELDDQGTCWMFHQLNFHYCLCRPDPSVHTHWLPHWALPIPRSEEI